MKHPRMGPALRYKDAPAATEWLCRARRFEKNPVAPGKDATIEHAQLAVGSDMILLGSVKDTEFDKFVALPSDVGRCTITLYIVVDDPDTHYARALNAGAKIMREATVHRAAGRPPRSTSCPTSSAASPSSISPRATPAT